jgi:hypothetical protein
MDAATTSLGDFLLPPIRAEDRQGFKCIGSVPCMGLF